MTSVWFSPAEAKEALNALRHVGGGLLGPVEHTVSPLLCVCIGCISDRMGPFSFYFPSRRPGKGQRREGGRETAAGTQMGVNSGKIPSSCRVEEEAEKFALLLHTSERRAVSNLQGVGRRSRQLVPVSRLRSIRRAQPHARHDFHQFSFTLCIDYCGGGGGWWDYVSGSFGWRSRQFPHCLRLGHQSRVCQWQPTAIGILPPGHFMDR